jgi:hypothetical protein
VGTTIAFAELNQLITQICCEVRWQFLWWPVAVLSNNRKILLCSRCFLQKHCDFCVQAWHSVVAFYILLQYLAFFKRTRNKSWKYHIQFLHNYWCSSVSYVLDYGWYTRYFLESSFISSRFTLLNFGTSYESSWNCYL